MDKRTLLAVVLSVIVLMVYQYFFAKPPVKKAPVQQETSVLSGQEKTVAVSPEKKAQTASSGTIETTGKTITAAAADGSEKDVVVETPLYRAVFTTRGAGLKSFELRHYKTSVPGAKDIANTLLRLVGRGKPEDKSAPRQIELVNAAEGMALPFTVSFPDSTINIPENALFETSENMLDLTRQSEKRTLIFTQSYPGQLRIDKEFTFYPDKYSFDMEIRLRNLGNGQINENISLSWRQHVDPNAPTDSYGHDGPVLSISDKIDRPNVKKMDADKTVGPYVSWGGYESKYFLSAMIPQNPSLTSLKLVKDEQNIISVNLIGPKNTIPPGQQGIFSYKAFLGPKDYTILKTQNIGLENAIDFGSWLKWLAIPMLISLKFLYGFVHNYGIAIILLTILIKLIFWPLGNKSYKSMKEMQKLQPKMVELRDKYKNDKARLSQESMALYKTHHVNPMGGCLPMVVQIPVFFGLYKALLYAIELRHAPFFWWIQDLSAKDPYYITPLVMGATMFIQQKMTPTGADPMQAKIMLFMPIIFTFMFLNFPSGLVIYWLLNNVISIGQQYYINKKLT
jgi:YidC/Oxa1 family membrane protein insertase